MNIKEQAKEAAIAAAFEESIDCPHCDGQGRLHDTGKGRKILHSFRSFIGCDWDLANVLAAIDDAAEVWWDERDILSHQLNVADSNGRVVRFDVKKPGDNT